MTKKTPIVNGPVTAKIKIGINHLKNLEKLTKKELVAIVREIRPDIEVPILQRKGELPDDHPTWADKEGTIIGYMDKVDFDYEIGGAEGGNKIYPSIANLQGCRPCTVSCGIVEVEVRLRRIIRESNFNVGGKPASEFKRIASDKKIKERQELHLTAAQLSILPPKKVEEILNRARKERRKK